MRKWFPKILTYVLAAGILFQVVSLLPSILSHVSMEGTHASSGKLHFLDGTIETLESLPGRKIFIFWATWCAPCEVELSRLNALIKSGKIAANDVVAISSHEESALVKQTVAERGYLFRVVLDSEGEIAHTFDVKGTPTVVFLDETKKVQWITTGISPTLEVRSLSFLGK